MQTEILDPVVTETITEQDVQRIAAAYITEQIGKSFQAVGGAYSYSKPQGRTLWRGFIRSEHGPVGLLLVDPQTSQVLPLTTAEIDLIREKAATLQARQQGRLPLGEDGYVISEYARRQANHYLSLYVGLQAVPTQATFVPLERPVWQFLIEVRLPGTGIIGVFGLIDVDARSGSVIPLTDEQIQQIWSRGNAAAELCTQKAAG